MKSFQLLLLIGFLLGVQCMRAQGDTLSRIPPVLHNVRQGHISTGAQEANHRHSLSLQWGVYIPTGKGFLNRATTISPVLEWEWRASNAVSIGAGIGYTRGAERNYTRDTYEGDLVTGPSDRSLTLMPLTAHFRWFPTTSPQHRLRPFIGAGIGVQYAVFRIEGELINKSEVQSWGAVVRPEAGVSFCPQQNGRICIEIKCGWQYATNKLPIRSIESLQGVQISAGVRYKFDGNGKFEGEVVVSGKFKGVDVSKYQGNINWNQVKASGVEFAIIRVGYRGYGSGALVEDPTFRQNIRGATAAGLKVGLYFYSQAVNEAEAAEEASMVLRLCSGYNISFPIYFDTEKVAGDTGRADNISRSQRTANAVTFCDIIRNAGYRAGVYSYASWFYNQLNIANLTQYSIWIAQYRDNLTFDYNYDIWQYTSSGQVPGIPARVDMNVSKRNF